MRKRYWEKIEIAFFSKVYFEINNIFGFKQLKKYWWKNVIVQIYSYNNFKFIISSFGIGITNASMATTYILKKYKNIKKVIMLDILDKKFNNICHKDLFFYSRKFCYTNVDFSKFSKTSKNQIYNERKYFNFNSFKNIGGFFFEEKELVTKTSDSIVVDAKISNWLIDLESCAVSQISSKFNVDCISYKTIDGIENCFSWNSIDSIKKIEYFKTIDNFKWMFLKVFIYFCSKINWNINLLCNENLEFLFELYYIDNFLLNLKNKKTHLEIISIDNSKLSVITRNDVCRNLGIFVLTDSNDKIKENFYNFVNYKNNYVDRFKNIKIDKQSIFFSKSESLNENLICRYYSEKLYYLISSKLKQFSDNIDDVFIKFEINSSFIVKGLLDNCIIDDAKFCCSFLILKITEKLNDTYMPHIENFKSISIYFYCYNGEYFNIVKIQPKIKRGKLFFKFMNIDILKNYKLLFFNSKCI